MSTMPCQTSRTPIQSLLEAAHTEAPAFGHPYEGVLSERFGFLFPQPPLLSMPASHIVWDEIASALPIALESGRVRCLIDLLPQLPADAASLDASYLCRAATVLGVLAHAYEAEINAGRKAWLPHPAQRPTLPDCVELPWTQVCQRLGRRQAAMTYYDLILHNWRMRDPAAEHPRDVENLDVLVPAFGNQEERIFYMTMVESHARSAALIGVVARIEGALLQRDFPALKAELQLIQRTMEATKVTSISAVRPVLRTPSSPRSRRSSRASCRPAVRTTRRSRSTFAGWSPRGASCATSSPPSPPPARRACLITAPTTPRGRAP
jgi:hypothetical protein